MITLFEKVTRCTDEGRAIGVIYVHTSTAFDKLPHGKRIEKIKAGRIQGDLANWIQNGVGNRRQADARRLFLQLNVCAQRDRCWDPRFL